MKGWKEKKLLRHWRKRHVKNWQLLILFFVCVGLSVAFLRQNSLKMDSLRSAVVVADETGGDVSGALTELNQHVFAHMNTEIVRPIELVNSYNREAQVVIEAAANTSERDIYAEATAVCERRGIPLSSIAQCTADYAVNNNPGVEPEALELPDKNLFIHTFATPFWTPDAAGFSILLTVVVALWLFLRFFEYLLVRLIVRRRLKNSF